MINCHAVFIGIDGQRKEEKQYLTPVPKNILELQPKILLDEKHLKPFEYVCSNNSVKIDYHFQQQTNSNHLMTLISYAIFGEEKTNKFMSSAEKWQKHFPNTEFITVGIKFTNGYINKISHYYFRRNEFNKLKTQPDLEVLPSLLNDVKKNVREKLKVIKNHHRIKIASIECDESHSIVKKLYVNPTNSDIYNCINQISPNCARTCMSVIKEYFNENKKLILISFKYTNNDFLGINLYF